MPYIYGLYVQSGVRANLKGQLRNPIARHTSLAALKIAVVLCWRLPPPPQRACTQNSPQLAIHSSAPSITLIMVIRLG